MMIVFSCFVLFRMYIVVVYVRFFFISLSISKIWTRGDKFVLQPNRNHSNKKNLCLNKKNNRNLKEIIFHLNSTCDLERKF